MKTVVVVNHAGMGHGDEELGERILQTLFSKVLSLKELEAIVFYNGGVTLLAEGSPMVPALSLIENRGVDLVACGTCIDKFDIREKIRVGVIGSMDSILTVLDQAEKVITL